MLCETCVSASPKKHKWNNAMRWCGRVEGWVEKKMPSRFHFLKCTLFVPLIVDTLKERIHAL